MFRLHSCMMLAVVVLMAAGCSKLPKQDAAFGAIKQEMTQLSAMPPTFQLQKVAAFSGETLSEMNHDIEKEIKACLEALIDESEIDLSVLNSSDEALAADPELRRAIFEQQAALAEAQRKIADAGKTMDVAYDGDIDYVADTAECDYLVFTDGYGYFKTAGAHVKEAVVAGISAALFGGFSSTPGSATALRVHVVDANRGKVVWYNEAVCQNVDPRKPSHIMKAAQTALKPLLGKSKLKGDKSRDDEIIDKYKDRELEVEEQADDE